MSTDTQPHPHMTPDERFVLNFSLPTYVLIVAIAAFVAIGAGWMVPVLLLAIFATVGGVIMAVIHMIDESDDDDSPHPVAS